MDVALSHIETMSFIDKKVFYSFPLNSSLYLAQNPVFCCDHLLWQSVGHSHSCEQGCTLNNK